MSSRYVGGIVTKNPQPLNPAAGNAANGVFTMDQYMQAVQGGTWPSIDPYFEYNTLLLHGNGTNGAQNNTFLDSSTNNFTITRNGNTTQGTFSPFSKQEGAWGNYFDNSGDYLQISSNAAFSFGTSDFTIECWFNASTLNTVASAPDGIISMIGSVGLYVSTNAIRVTHAGVANLNDFSATLSTNTWYHLALTRSGTSMRAFVNGVQTGSTYTNSTNFSSTGNIRIGTETTQDFHGYISNLRVVKGTAQYTSNFTPPTAPLTAITNTSLLTCQSNRFKDNSSNNFTITANGNTAVTPFSPFPTTSAYSATVNGGSGYFDGSGDNLTSATVGTTIGTGDWCLECWVYQTVTASFSTFVQLNNSSGYNIFLQTNSGTARFLNFQNPGTDFTISGGTVPLNSWTHIVGTLQSGTARLFVNGVLVANQGSLTRNYGTAGTVVSAPASASYASDIRVTIGSVPTSYQTSSTTNGTAVFTPPSAPMTTSSQGATSGDVDILLNCTNAGILDNTMSNNLETVGNAQIDTAVKKFGDGSMEFDGNGDYVKIVPSNSPNIDISVGNFTIECWVYFTTFVNDSKIYIDITSAGAYAQWNYSTSTGMGYIISSGTVTSISQGSTSGWSTGTWYHVALVRNGDTYTIYRNGTSIASGTRSGAVGPFASKCIGGAEGFASTSINGYIDDFRITKGIARYTSNFAVPYLPTQALPLNGGSYAPYTTLMLPGTGTNGAQNNTFLDSSTNNFTITRNGNTTQGTFSPFSRDPGYWGNYFDGSGDYLTLASNSAFDLGSGNFTIECWVNPSSFNATAVGILSKRASVATANQIGLELSGSSGTIRFAYNSGGSEIGVTGGTATVNTWQHIAVVRNGSTITIYKDGVSTGTATISVSITTNADNLAIGAVAANGSFPFTGNISNLRIVKGSAVYTSNFTPSSSPLTNIANTSLLTCQSNRFIDNSSNNFAITVNGNTLVSAFSPFGYLNQYSPTVNGGSGYFDGTGDYLSIASATALSFDTGDFTVDGWFYANSIPTQPTIVSNGSDAGGLVITLVSNKIYAYFVGVGNVFGSGGATLTTGTWYHFAWVRSGSTHTFYINGTAYGSTYSSSANHSSTGGAGIGFSVSGTTFNAFNGYISGVRYIKGSAVYTSNFTPPTAPPTAITNTSLLCNFTNAGIYDASMSNDLETVGNAQISTSVSKWGGGSMYFDGTGDYLRAPTSDNFALGTGDFTAEMWFYIAGNSSPDSGSNRGAYLFDNRDSAGTADGMGLLIVGDTTTTGTGLTFLIRLSGTTYTITYTGTISQTTWHHIAVVRSGTTCTIYFNGTSVASNASFGYSINSTNPLKIGGSIITGFLRQLNGYIADFRILKGVALLPTALQTSQWQDQ